MNIRGVWSVDDLPFVEEHPANLAKLLDNPEHALRVRVARKAIQMWLIELDYSKRHLMNYLFGRQCIVLDIPMRECEFSDPMINQVKVCQVFFDLGLHSTSNQPIILKSAHIVHSRGEEFDEDNVLKQLRADCFPKRAHEYISYMIKQADEVQKARLLAISHGF